MQGSGRKEFIKSNTEWLSEHLDPDFGLLDNLLRNHVLSMKEISQVKCLPESFARSEKLLIIVLGKDIHEKFIEALRSTKQIHLANFIVAKGERKSMFGDDWPLTDHEIQTLDTNREALVDLIDACQLVGMLYSKNVINNRQMDAIASKSANYEKNDLLLDTMRRKSLNDYRLMIDCLRVTNQSHIAQILNDRGVILPLHAHLEAPDVDKVEEEIVTKLTDILSNRTLEESDRILEQTKLRLIEVKRGHSVILYIHIKTLEELMYIEEGFASGKLTMHITALFNQLLSRTSIARLNNVYIDLPQDAFMKAGLLLSVKGQKQFGDQSQTEKQESTTKNEIYDKSYSRPFKHEDTTPRAAVKSLNMSEAGHQLQKLTECCICYQAYTDPRTLPCIHTFCLECLKQTAYAAKKKSGENMPCPLCRKVFLIPANGLDGLQKNFFIQHLMEVTTNLQLSSTSVVLCDICKQLYEGDEKARIATMRCFECRNNFCDICAKTHKLQKLSKDHHIAKIGSHTKEDSRKLLRTGNCTDHNEKPLDLYCADCKKILCVTCFVENHSSHNCKDASSVEKQFRKTIQRNVIKISSFADEMLKEGKSAEQRKENILLQLAQTESEIRKRNIELKEMIDDHTKSLLDELSLIKQKQIKVCENEKEEIERSHVILKSFETYCTELRSKGSTRDICSCVDKLSVRADELEKDHKEFIGRPRRSFEVSFQSTDIREVLEKKNRIVVGQIKAAKTQTTTRIEHCAIVVGLDDGPTITSKVIQINLRRPNEISTQQQIPTEMQREATAAVYCNTMYVTGIGYNANEIWKYNLASGWMQCASLVQGRRRHSAAFIDEVLYICGGLEDSDGRVLKSVEAYNAVTDKCSKVGRLVHCVQSSGNCVPFKISLYIFGGRDKDDKALSYVQVYNTKLNKCTLLSKPMPRPHGLLRAALWETFVILVGLDTCFIFNFETENWQERKQFKTDVGHFGLVLENERLFVIGGGIGETVKDGTVKWKCRDEVRYVSIRNVIEDKPTEWKIHAKLPQPSLIQAYEQLSCVIP